MTPDSERHLDGSEAPSTGSAQTGPPDPTIPFRSGAVTPSAGVNESLRATVDAMPLERTLWALIQFQDGPPVDRLDAYGVRTESYLVTGHGRSDAHYAGIPAGNFSAVSGLESVRAITPIRPAWKLGPRLERRMANASGQIPVRVHAFDSLSHETLTRQSEDWYSGSLSPDAVRHLLERDIVSLVEYRAPVRSTLSETGAEVGDWMAQADGYSGAGANIGVVDDGIDGDHTHFDSVDVTGVRDYVECDDDPTIGDNGASHGTHTAGTIAGNGFGPHGKQLTGIAPDASLYISRVMDANGNWAADCGFLGTGLKEIFTDQYNAGARVVSNSWGADTSGDYDGSAQKVDEWTRTHRDALLVFANGNAGQDSHAISPGIAKNAIAVGATSDGSNRTGQVNATSVEYVGSIADINAIDPPDTGQTKPDVNAPGANLTAPINGDGYGYGTGAGSSMATPVVAALAGLYKSKHGSNTHANEIKAALLATSHDVSNPVGGLTGHGEVNADNLLQTNDYESMQAHFLGSVTDGEEETLTLHVPSDAEKVVVSLSWTDCAGSATTEDPVVNELHLNAGPTWDPLRNLKNDGDRTTRKIVDEDPPSGDWEVGVWGASVSCGSSQDYDGFFRVVTEKPTLDVSAPDTVTMTAGESKTIQIDATGTGAPVYGIHGTLDTPSGLSLTDSSVEAANWIFGMLSSGNANSHSVAVTSDTYGTHTLTATVDSRNAASGTITKDVTVEVVDESPPSSVSNLRSSTHAPGSWSTDDSVGVAWDAATDHETSVAGYSVVWDHSSSTTPDSAIDLGRSTTSTSKSLNDDEWYFHVRAVDEYGNAGPTQHIGPFQIDTMAPSSSHSLAGTLGDNGWYTSAVDVTLSARDDLSGVDYTQYVIGGGSTTKGSSVTISADGQHTVQYNAVDVAGNSEAPNEVGADIDTTAPSASFSVTPTEPTTGESISFDAGGSSDATAGIANYAWDLDGDGSTEATGQSASYTYDNSGDYPVTLTVTDAAGNTDSTSQTVSVTADSGPSAVSNLHSPSHDTNTWSNLSTVDVAWDPATDEETSVDGYSVVWDHSSSTTPDNSIELDSGTTSTIKTVSDGEWHVHVRAVDTEGNAGPTEHLGPFQIDTAPPGAAFTHSPTHPNESEQVSFDGSGSTDDASGIASLAWDLDGDGSTEATGSTASYTYGTAGDHAVTLTVTDQAGNTNTTSATVTVNALPTAVFDYSPSSPDVGETVSVDAGDATDADGTIDAYAWDFGDGTTATGQSVSHSFDASGTYTVTLTVTDDDGAMNTTYQAVSVGSVEPLTEEWTAETAGRTQHSEPAVGSARVFVGGLDDTVSAFYRANGSVDWRFDRSGSLADSSPALWNGRVIVGSGSGTIYALDADTGQVTWTYATDSAVVSSPRIANGTVFVGSNDGTVIALDATDGTETWTAEVGGAVYSQPAVDTGRVIVTTRRGRILALDAVTGAENWRRDTGADLGHGGATVADGQVFVAADSIYALSLSDGSTVWSTAYGGPAGSTPTYSGGRVFVGGAGGTIYGLNASTGTVSWTAGTGGAVGSNPAVVSDRVVVGSTDGSVYLLDAATGSVVTTATGYAPIRSSPDVGSETVFVGTRQGTVIALGNVLAG